MKSTDSGGQTWMLWLVAAAVTLGLAALPCPAQPAPQQPGAAPPAASPLAGRIVEDIRIVGNTQVSTAVIMNAVRTRVGAPLDPSTVEEDYQRIFGLRKFSEVEAKVEPTETGVIVVFSVREQNQINSIVYRGNFRLDDQTLSSVVDLRVGEAVDPFRLALAKSAIENLYRSRNFPFAHVEIDQERLARTGDLVFKIVEGPNVRVRKVDFIGNNSFTADRLKSQIRTRHWIWILRPGTFDPEQVEDDVAALRRYYESKGFFDVRVGRKIIASPDNSEIQVTFLIEEGRRYVVERVTFKGNSAVSDTELRSRMKLLEGQTYDEEILRRDVREIVRAYSPFGFIYQPQSTDPNFLQIGTANEPAKKIFRRDAGTVELVYDIREGKPFKLGRIIIKGNSRTQDKVILREMKMSPGELYNSGAVQDATERLRGTPFFSSVTMTPIGEDEFTRDLLVEVAEQRTASFNIGAGVNSNGGFGANITYEQRNFDIRNWPSSPRDIFNGNAFIGAGQSFRISLEPGSEISNASIRFREPYIFDQPFGFTVEGYARDRIREDYRDRRLGGRIALDHRFNDFWTGAVSLRAENVRIFDIEDKPIRADEILEEDGTHFLSSVGFRVTRDTTNRGFLPYRGTTTGVGVEFFGLLGGDYTFQRFVANWDAYFTLREDILDRRVILELHADAGYITGDAPFFERFYGGGIGSIRGFQFRGVSPRSGPADDRVGGDFLLTGTAQISFPLVGEQLRGVVFTDVGTVEEDFRLGTIRASVGAGIRLTLAFLGQTPVAIDLAYPLSKDDEDDTQIISFSLGIER
ncbi:MAG: outer membrane protein assembly factor BamA [Phycisphaerae bacterium]|nr:outer membrane protein assembly factor BamA [Phycisphaerae bacterium]MDW8263237.1 outer membrane protein assembly factor BamA [Phycisphaerales bacterium]